MHTTPDIDGSILRLARSENSKITYLESGLTNHLTQRDGHHISLATASNVTINRHGMLVPDFTSGLTGVNLALDQLVVNYLWVSIVAVLSVVFLLRLWQLFNGHIRHIFALNATRHEQKYWTFDKTWWWPWLKREVIYAPLGSKRHNREIQLSRAVNYGTLPSRIHFFLLTCYVLSNVIYILILPYHSAPTGQLIAELRGRTGMLAVVNMMPLIILASRNNPVIGLLKISFDNFNLFHRWLGRLIIFEAIIHVSAWYTNLVMIKGHSALGETLRSGWFIQFGLLAFSAFLIILFQSLSPIRHAFYEIFLHIHQLMAFLGILGVYVHLEIVTLPALPFIRVVVGLWLSERVIRMIRLYWVNVNFRRRQVTRLQVEALEGEACRLTFLLPNHITIRPGSHVYAYIPRISWWQSHPFSVAWTDFDSEPANGFEFSDMYEDDLSLADKLEAQNLRMEYNPKKLPTTVSLVCAARTGMTRKLYNQAKSCSPRVFNTTGFVEGPYAGHECLNSYGTVVMFAGGAGITHHLIQIRHLIAGAHAGTVATRKIVLAWTIRDQAALTWVQPWMDEILAMPGRKGMLTICLYITRPRDNIERASPSRSVQLIPRRCDPGQVLDEVLPERVGAVMVTVCGPGAFADEVRAAVRARLDRGVIDMNEESFTW